jgi:hypothetical protein
MKNKKHKRNLTSLDHFGDPNNESLGKVRIVSTQKMIMVEQNFVCGRQGGFVQDFSEGEKCLSFHIFL